MTREEYAKAIKEWEAEGTHSAQTFPVPGVMLTPLCKICRNYRSVPYGTGQCKALGTELPVDLRNCKSYSCDKFDHDPKSWFNSQFTSDLKPKRTADKVFDDDYE